MQKRNKLFRTYLKIEAISNMPSYPRRRVSRHPHKHWIPVCTGMTTKEAHSQKTNFEIGSSVYPMLPTNSGMSLVEVMIALLVLLFVSLALMQTALVSIESNMKSVLRDEAVSIADQRMAEARDAVGSATGFDILTTDGTDTNLTADKCPSGFWSSFGNHGVYVTRNLKNIQNFGYCTHRDVSGQQLGVENKAVTVTISWLWKGEQYVHTNSTVLRRPSQ